MVNLLPGGENSIMAKGLGTLDVDIARNINLYQRQLMISDGVQGVPSRGKMVFTVNTVLFLRTPHTREQVHIQCIYTAYLLPLKENPDKKGEGGLFTQVLLQLQWVYTSPGLL